MSKLTLCYSSGSCSTASHIALEYSGLPYEGRAFDIASGAARGPEYLAINPKGGIPALMIDDQVLTESQAILTFIGDLAAERAMIPKPGTLERARAHEMMNFLSSTVHIAFRQVLRPSVFVESDAAQAEVRANGFAKLTKALVWLDGRLGGRPHAVGDSFGIVDAYLFIFFLWGSHPRTQGRALPGPNYRRNAEATWALPETKRVIEREGFDMTGILD